MPPARAQTLASVEAKPFSTPVSDEDAPGYAAIVGRPMDLGTVRENVAARVYAHPAQAYADVRQVRRTCTHARMHGFWEVPAVEASTRLPVTTAAKRHATLESMPMVPCHGCNAGLIWHWAIC